MNPGSDKVPEIIESLIAKVSNLNTIKDGLANGTNPDLSLLGCAFEETYRLNMTRYSEKYILI